MDHAGGAPQGIDPSCLRTQFLEELLADQEHDRLSTVEAYLARFPTIEPFVRSEYLAFAQPAPTPTDDPLDRDTNCGRYRLVRRIAEGGMGVVYEALDVDLARRVVIKMLRPELATSVQGIERLRREARVLGRLEHPNLAKILELFEEKGCTHLVMPFHAGRTLADLLEEARAQSEAGNARSTWPALVPANERRERTLRRILSFFQGAAAALHSAHEVGVVHRDIKPQNLLVGPDGDPIVLDFGLALPEADERLTIAGELLGTPRYMAPEQIEGTKADARTDVYALGVCLYETLTLVHPIASGSREAIFHRVLQGAPVPPRRHQPLIPRDLEAIVMRAMDRQPKRRYQDMAAFARDLQRVLDLEPTEARPISRFDLAWRGIRRRPLTALLTAVAIAGVAMAVRNQIRLDDVKRWTAEALAPRDSDQTLVELRTKTRDRSPDGTGDMELIYPRGKVSQVDRFTWTCSATHEPDFPGIRFLFTFRIEVLDGDRVVAHWLFEQPAGTTLCTSSAPATLHLDPGRPYRWRAHLVGYTAIGEGAFDLRQLEECQSVQLAELRMPGLETNFALAATRPAALQAGSGTAEDRARSLLAEGLFLDAIVVLVSDDPGREHAGEVGCRELLRRAVAELPPVVEVASLPASATDGR